MKIKSFKTLHGPNVYHRKAILKMTLDLEEYSEIASDQIEGFIDRLIAMFPGIREHRCSLGTAGGFITRLKQGTYFGHIIEHIALEMSELTGSPVYYGKTTYAGRRGLYDVAVRFNNQAAMQILLEGAVKAVQAAARGDDFDITDIIIEAQKAEERTALGPSTQAILDAALARGIPCRRISEGSLIQLGFGKNRRLVKATLSDSTSLIAGDIASDKELTKQILRNASIPVPEGSVCRTFDEAEAIFAELSGACVVKPLDANQGRGVVTNIKTVGELRFAFEAAKRLSREVIVEEQFIGDDYRMLVVDGKMIAASKRTPPFVVGNGKNSIAELIEAENKNPLRGKGHSKPLSKIEIDTVLEGWLKRKGYKLSSVLKSGQKLNLRGTANLSTGGTAEDVTDLVHPEVKAACERASRLINLDICGIDLIASDISERFSDKNGLIELNAAPGIRMHEFPARGRPRMVGGAICEMLFPKGQNGRIPIVSITGTNGKTTVSRLVASMLSAAGLKVGNTNSDGIVINRSEVAKGDTTGYLSAMTVLSDPLVEAAVLETARGGIQKMGLAYDWSDVSVLTNIQADHIGQGNIENLEDLYHVKSVVAECTRPGGRLVLNAEDPLVASVPERSGLNDGSREIAYFALDRNNPVIKAELTHGGTCYILERGWLCEISRHGERRIIRASYVPQSCGGFLKFQIANTLAAIAAARGLGLEFEAILEGLKIFEAAGNPGRMNWYSLYDGYVVLDYGHNPGAFEAWGPFLSRWSAKRTCVFTVPGDRSEELIAQSCRIVARQFDKIIVREDAEKRDRRPGEIMEFIYKEIFSENPLLELAKIEDEAGALEAALDALEPGEIVFHFYEDQELVKEAIAAKGAKAISDGPVEPAPFIEEEAVAGANV